MKKFKTFDFFISVVLIATFVVYWLIKRGDSIFLAYFVVGGWQVISMLVHQYNRCFTYKGGRRQIYHWITLVSIITMPLGSFWILFFTAPFMAIFYTWLCYREVYFKMQRPLAMLK